MLSTQSPNKNVVINAIWFSTDGSISNNAIENFKNLSLKIKNSAYKDNYKVVLWTNKLRPNVKQLLESYKITIKNFCDVNLSNEQEIKFFDNLKQFVALGNNKDKLPFSMASDLLRTYIILRHYSQNYSNDVAMYIDCNDINITTLPDPNTFNRIKGLSAAYVSYRFYVNNIEEKKSIINTDVTIANNANGDEFGKIFNIYCHNIDIFTTDKYKTLAEKYAATRSQAGFLDLPTCQAMAFGVTHLFTLIYPSTAADLKPFLVEHQQNNLKLMPINVANATNYLDYERQSTHGQTWHPDKWLQQSSPKTELVEDWINNFISRKSLMTAFSILLNTKLAYDASLVEVLLKYPQSAENIVKGLTMLTNHPELPKIYQDVILNWSNKDMHDQMSSAFSLAQGLLGLKQNGRLNDDAIYKQILNAADSYFIYHLADLYRKNRSRLHDAIMADDITSAKALLEKGVDPNLEFNGDDTLFLTAVKKGNPEIVELMLTIGKANPNQKNKNDETLLTTALSEGFTKIAELLLKTGANPNQADKDGHSPLLHATSRGDLETVELLLDKGANPKQVNKFNFPPLIAAMVKMDESESNMKMMELLLTKGANPNQVCGEDYSLTPLSFAIDNNLPGTLKLLLAHGANVNEDTDDGFTILLCATMQGKREIVEILLANGADPNRANKDDLTPLLHATSTSNTEIVNMLLAKGANPVQIKNVSDNNSNYDPSFFGNKSPVAVDAVVAEATKKFGTS